MKKFFRALALVLALALVVGVVPAQTASAKAKEKKTLYVGGPQGASTTDDTLKSSYKARASIAKLAGLTKAQKKAGAKVTAKLVSGDSVTIGKKYIVAESFGKSIVEFSIDGKAVGQTVINCKMNATKDTLTFDGLEDGQEVVAGLEYTVSLPRAGKDSDERRLFVEGEAVAEIEGKARQYAVKFTEVGKTYTIKAESFQSTNLDKATCSAEISVKCVAPKTVDAEQLSAYSFAVTFNSPITGLIDMKSIENQNIYYMILDEKVVTGVIKSIEYDEDDTSRVIITMYSKFLDDEDYYFVYGDNDPVKFHSASNKLSEVDKIVLVDAGAYYVGTEGGTQIKYKLLNKKGIELSITEVPVFTIDSDVAWMVGTNGDYVYFFEEGTATIKASLDQGYDEETYEPLTVTSEPLKIKGVTKAAATIVDKTYSFNGKYSDQKHTIRLKQNEAGTNNGILQVQFKMSDNTKPVVTTATLTDGTAATSGYYMLSTDETVAVVINGRVSGVKKGQATIVLYSVGEDVLPQTEDDYVVAVFSLTVDDENRGKTATATLSKGTLNTHTNLYDGSGAVANDQVKLNIVVKDLDDQNYPADQVDVSILQVKNNETAVGVKLKNVGTAVNATNYLTAANFETTDTEKFGPSTDTVIKTARVSFIVKVTDKKNNAVLCTTTLNVVIADIDGDYANTWKLETSANSLDVSAKNYGTSATIKTSADFTLNKVRTSGYGNFYCGGDSWTEIKNISEIPTSAGAAGTTTNYIIRSFPKDANDQYVNVNATNNKISVNRFAYNASGAAVALKGQYTVTGYRVVFDTTANSDGTYPVKSKASLSTVVTTVNQSDVKATITIADGKAETLRNNGLAVDVSTGEGTFTPNNNVFIVNWDGLTSKDNPGRVQLTGNIKAKVDTTTTAVYIYSVEAILYPSGYTGDGDIFFFQDVPVNRLFKDNY